jgi:hypothetical protein
MYNAEFEFEAELEDLMAMLAESELESEVEGELYVPPTQVYGPPNRPSSQLTRDQSVVNDQMVRGVRDENKLTDAVFYDRHPDWKGKSLKNATLSLRQEWIQIRDSVVRPTLKNPSAPPPSVAPVTPVPAAPATPPSQGSFGNSTFPNVLKYSPADYPLAIASQIAYQKVSSFLPYYQKISLAAPSVSIAEAQDGIGNLVFSMDKQSFANLVEDQGLREEALKIAVGGVTSELIFTEDIIGVLGIGFTLLDIAQGLNNEHLLGSFGPDHDKWVQKQQYQFVFGLLAEDLSKHNWGNGYFYSRNTRDLALEIAQQFADFQPVYNTYGHYYWLDDDLGKYQGNIPDYIPPSMSAAP